MLIKATIAGGGVIPHIHKSLLEKARPGEAGVPPQAPWIQEIAVIRLF